MDSRSLKCSTATLNVIYEDAFDCPECGGLLRSEDIKTTWGEPAKLLTCEACGSEYYLLDAEDKT